MFNEQYVLVPLTERKDLCLECIELLNQEWPRSIGARENTLRKSLNSRPPMSFVLVDKNTKLVGHARLCPLPAVSHSCWIESVIIDSNLRGKGLGGWLMAQLEDEARKFGFRKAYLSSKNKQGFYVKCGYSICEPVLNVGANTSLLEKFDVGKFFGLAAFNGSNNGRITQTDSSNPSTSCTYVIPSGKSLPLPPLARRPPPPPILTSVLLSPNEVLKSGSKKKGLNFVVLLPLPFCKHYSPISARYYEPGITDRDRDMPDKLRVLLSRCIAGRSKISLQATAVETLGRNSQLPQTWVVKPLYTTPTC